MRKISVNSRPVITDDNKVREIKTFKLPSIHQEGRERLPIIPSRKSPPLDTVPKNHAPRLSISPLKTSKE